ncbi:MAG: hypothetical protein WD403_12525 [Pirellulales bacterium]
MEQTMRRFERLVLACAFAWAVVGLALAVAGGEPDGRRPRWEMAIRQALNEPTEFKFVDRPLTDIADELRARHKIQIHLDRAALTDAGVGEDMPITASLSGISLGAALKLMLLEHELAYVIRNEVLLITSQTEADGMLETRVYPVGDLVRFSGDETSAEWRPDYDSLIEAIISTIPPCGWDCGDVGYIEEFANCEALVISQTADEHERIEKLLADLRATCDKQAAYGPHDRPRDLTSEPESSPAQAAIKNALNEKTDIDFVDRPLTDMAEYLESRHKIEIELDRKALLDVGVDNAGIRAHLSGISLGSALELILGPLELTYVIRDDVLLITSKTEAEGMMEARVYPVADLVRPPDDWPLVEPSPDFDGLIMLIVCSIEPTQWEGSGPINDVQGFDNCGALVILQTADVHDQIEKLLMALRETRRNAMAGQRGVEPAPDNGLTLKAYRVPFFWLADQAKSEQELVRAIPNVLEPATWQTAGGAGTIRVAAGLLWIEQTEAVHRQIGRLLAALE